MLQVPCSAFHPCSILKRIVVFNIARESVAPSCRSVQLAGRVGARRGSTSLSQSRGPEISPDH